MMNQRESDREEIGGRLRWAREQAGLSQGQVARLMDLHRPTISEIEAGRRSVKAEEISRFADLYDVRRDWIVGGESVLPGENDPRIELAARELRRLKPKDLDAILRLIQILRTPRSRA